MNPLYFRPLLLAFVTLATVSTAAYADLMVPGTPSVGSPNPGGGSVAYGEGGGIGVQPIVDTAFGPNPFSVTPGDVVVLNDPSGADTPSNFEAVIDFFNPADPTGTLGLAATEYETYYGGNVGPTTFADLTLSADTIFLPQSSIVQTGIFAGNVAAVTSVYGPNGAVEAGQHAILLFEFAPQPAAIITAVPEPITLSLFGAGLAGAAAMRRRKKAKQV